ncbi:hypothetical protein H8E88_04970 [candidate division KSB1 bacterium]|nr:hypothetical protein [candidate division KSB1 bacterium]
MKVYYFADTDWKNHLNISTNQLTDVLTKVSSGTNTDDLVLALYLINRNSASSGVAYVQKGLTKKQFITFRGRWTVTKNFPIPDDLPEKYKLIRLQFGINYLRYPLRQHDRYGWELSFKTFIDHFAFLFAHELHHFRRFHLGFHPREGENSANKWALHKVRELGFDVAGEKISQKKNNSLSKRIHSKLYFDKFKKFQKLDQGDRIFIQYDPQGRYQSEAATVLRPIRKNSRRIVVKTNDGKHWRWPMDWVVFGD